LEYAHDALMISYAEWMKLSMQHPDDNRDFVNAIHIIQNLLAFRIARRKYPKFWKDHSKLDHKIIAKPDIKLSKPL
jgi:hypothetical protein